MERKVELATAVALNALQSWAKRNGNRNILDEGKSHDVKLEIVGIVDRVTVSQSVSGKLTVGVTNPTGSTIKPDQKTLLAALIEELPKTRLEKLMKEFDKGIPEPSSESVKSAELILSKLSKKAARAGSVKFQEAA